jgi:hypothetical protein
MLPRILEPVAVNQLIAALRTARDRAMVEAMVLGGLRHLRALAARCDSPTLGSALRRFAPLYSGITAT